MRRSNTRRHFQEPAQSPVGIREKWFPLLQNVQNHICVDQDLIVCPAAPFVSFLHPWRSLGDDPHKAVQDGQLVDGRLVRRAMFLPFLVMNISCFMAISKYLPRLVLNSVAVTIIICAPFMMYSMSFFIFIIRKSHEIVKKPYRLFRAI